MPISDPVFRYTKRKEGAMVGGAGSMGAMSQEGGPKWQTFQFHSLGR